MKKSIVFATHNQHKVEEVSKLLPNVDVLSLEDIHYTQEIEETGQTFKENAEIKAQAVYQNHSVPVFADDSGLVIPTLNGEPGIYSARYAGTGNSSDNIQKVLSELKNEKNREAYFITMICLIFNSKKYYFEGRVDGTILSEIQGENGFGYDPIFQPKGYDKSFAALGSELKNAISHRSRAVIQMKNFLMRNF